MLSLHNPSNLKKMTYIYIKSYKRNISPASYTLIPWVNSGSTLFDSKKNCQIILAGHGL